MKAPDHDWLARLRAALDYCPVSGEFTWKIWRGNSAKPGAAAGPTDSKGHRQIRFEGRQYLAHRLAWVMFHGRWPLAEIDHVNRVRDDNRVENLRECSHAENSKNRGTYASNTSGVPGVSWYPKNDKWVAWIRADGKRKHLGYFATLAAAAEARACAEAEHYGSFREAKEDGHAP